MNNITERRRANAMRISPVLDEVRETRYAVEKRLNKATAFNGRLSFLKNALTENGMVHVMKYAKKLGLIFMSIYLCMAISVMDKIENMAITSTMKGTKNSADSIISLTEKESELFTVSRNRIMNPSFGNVFKR